MSKITLTDNIPRAVVAAFISAAKGSRDPARICAQRYPDDQVTPRLFTTRAAVSGATTAIDAWAGMLASKATGAYFSALPRSAASRLIAIAPRVDLDGNNEVVIPVRSTQPGPIQWVGEAEPIPVAAYGVGHVSVGPPSKLAVISVFSRELAKHSAAQSVIETILAEDASYSLDSAFFNGDAATASSPAGLLNGATPLTSTGTMVGDLAALAAAVATGGSGQVVFVTSPDRAAVIGLNPDVTATVFPSLPVASDRVIAVDPLALVSGFGADPEISASQNSTLHMADPASHIGTAGTPTLVAAPTLSTFQTANVAVRLIAEVAFAMRRNGAVAYMDVEDW